jgi:hypothetical protein
VMRLRTDFYDRGTVTITPREQATADLRLEIGAGPIRVPNARPPQVSELCVSGVTVPTFTSALALALHLLDSEGPGMSIALAKTADPSAAIASFRYSPALSTNQAIRKTLGGASPGETGSSDSPKTAAYAPSAPFPGAQRTTPIATLSASPPSR